MKGAHSLFFRRSVSSLLIAVVLFYGHCAPTLKAAQAADGTLLVAAASNLRFPLEEAVGLYHKTHHLKVKVSYGASGSLFAQIMAGAPYDIFFSADEAIPQKLIRDNFARADSFFIYGSGRIVLWVVRRSPIDLDREGLKALLHPAVKKIALANPRHAPYGMAAVAALKQAGYYDRLAPKLVFGENVSQTADFVRTGGADIAILSYSLACSSPLEKAGRYWPVPDDLYPSMFQAGIILLRSENVAEAEAFIRFIAEGAGRAILEKYGLLNTGLVP